MMHKALKGSRKPLIVLVLFLILGSVVSAKVSKVEKRVLLEIYQSTNGPGWTHAWNLSEPVSSWYGVGIDKGKVVSLNLFNNNLTGVLPKSIGKLSHLRVFNIAFNSIEGTIPQEVVLLQRLQELRMGKNRLTGAIPENIGRLKELEVLDFFANQLIGHLPSSLGQLTKLRVLMLSENRLSGSIPQEIGKLTALQSMELGNNHFEGEVPDTIGNLWYLERLILTENQLGGAFPRSIFLLPKLDLLQIQNNDFSKDEMSAGVPSNNQYSLLDFGEKDLPFEQEKYRVFSIEMKTRTADTKFDDED